MTRAAAYAIGGLAAIAVGVLGGSLGPVLYGAPLLVLAVALLGEAPPTQPHVAAGLSRTRVLEGAEVDLTLELTVAPGTRCDVAPVVPWGVRVSGGPVAVMPADVELKLALHAHVAGAHGLGAVALRLHGPLGARRRECVLGEPLVLRVYPRAPRLRPALSPDRTREAFGDRRSGEHGDGLEFANLRPFAAGDDPRRVSWRASARLRRPVVVERHPERAADVVLVLDTAAELRRADQGTSDDVLRLATGLAWRQLEQRDRVGVLTIADGVWWLRPQGGQRSLHRITDALIENGAGRAIAFPGLGVVDRRLLTPRTLVAVLSPLLEVRSFDLIHDLRRRRVATRVVEIDPLGYLDPPADEWERLAQQVWRVSRQAQIRRLAEAGIPVTTWQRASAQ